MTSETFSLRKDFVGLLSNQTFVCFDLETTGLLPEEDRIIEIAAAKFTFDSILDTMDTLIDPEVPIPQVSIDIHHITDQMVVGKQKIREVLPSFLEFIKGHVLVGHGIPLDISFIIAAAKRLSIPNSVAEQPYLDTLRLARLYGESPINSLEKLREHFNIPAEGAHRAMNDVVVNIAVFKQLCKLYKTTEQLFERLKKPILLKKIPLGKHKGRPFSEIPLEYLLWAANKDFDQDLLFSIRMELNRRKKGNQFGQATNPFASL